MRRAITFLAAALLATGVSAASLDGWDYMPPTQQQSLRIIEDFAERYAKADNELKKSTLWKERTAALNAVKAPPGWKPAPGQEGWLGNIVRLGTTGEGNAYVTLQIGKGITVSTTNNELSAAIDKRSSLIKHGSPLYKQLSELKVGAPVRFTGKVDFTGIGLTEAGKMTQPDFLMQLNTIRPFVPPAK